MVTDIEVRGIASRSAQGLMCVVYVRKNRASGEFSCSPFHPLVGDTWIQQSESISLQIAILHLAFFGNDLGISRGIGLTSAPFGPDSSSGIRAPSRAAS